MASLDRKKRKEKKLKKKRKNNLKKAGRKGRRLIRKMKPQGNSIDINHQQYWLTYGMMLGIRTTVGKERSSEGKCSHSNPCPEPPSGPT